MHVGGAGRVALAWFGSNASPAWPAAPGAMKAAQQCAFSFQRILDALPARTTALAQQDPKAMRPNSVPLRGQQQSLKETHLWARSVGIGHFSLAALQAQPPGLQSVLEIAVSCLGQRGAEATGAALLEGLLCVAPAPCFACCLHVALMAPASEARSAALGMLCNIPPGMLPPEVVADAVAQVSAVAPLPPCGSHFLVAAASLLVLLENNCLGTTA
jgi:hypothetical protein